MMTKSNQENKKKSRFGYRSTVIAVTLLTMSTGVNLRPAFAATTSANPDSKSAVTASTSDPVDTTNVVQPTETIKDTEAVADKAVTGTDAITATKATNNVTSKAIKVQAAENTPTSTAAKVEVNQTSFDDPTNIATGNIGINWYITSAGVLHLEAGAMQSISTTVSPWKAYASNITSIEFDGIVVAGASVQYLFGGLTKVTAINNLADLDTSNVTDMNNMFSSLQSLESLDVSHFDTSKVINMSFMFNSLKSLKALDVSNFDTSNVTDMSYMFSNTSEITTLDLSNFNTQNVTTMDYMFSQVLSDNQSHLAELNISSFDTSKVVNMNSMFFGLSELKSVDVSGFDTSNVTKMRNMFNGSGLESLNISNFNTSKVTGSNFKSMLSGMTSLKSLTLGLTNPNFSNAGLPEITSDDTYTGKWVSLTNHELFTSQELMTKYTSAGTTTAPETYIWQRVGRVNVNDSTIISGPSATWSALDDFVSATNDLGEPIDYSGVEVSGTVDPTIVGDYQVTYRYTATGGITTTAVANVHVVPSEISLAVKSPITLIIGDGWNNNQAFISATDAEGHELLFGDITVTGAVDTSKAGTYDLTYQYTDNVGNVVNKAVVVKVTAKDVPTQPTDPTKPTQPTEPGKPTDLSKPTLPEQSNKQKLSNQNKLPQTNEAKSNYAVVVAGMVLMFSSILVAVGLRRRHD